MTDSNVPSILAGAAVVLAQSRQLHLATLEVADTQVPHCVAVVFTCEGLVLRMLFGRDGANYRRMTTQGRAAFATGDFERVEGTVHGQGRVADAGEAEPHLPALTAKYAWLDPSTVSGNPRCIELVPERLSWVRLAPGGVIHEVTIARGDAGWAFHSERVKSPR